MNGYRRRAALAAAGCILVGAAAIGVHEHVYVRRHSVNYDDYQRITRGMTKKEVERLLGGPPGDYSTGSIVTISSGNCWWTDQDAKWIGDKGVVIVRFKDDGTVAGEFLSGDPMKAFIPGMVCPGRRWLDEVLDRLLRPFRP